MTPEPEQVFQGIDAADDLGAGVDEAVPLRARFAAFLRRLFHLRTREERREERRRREEAEWLAEFTLDPLPALTKRIAKTYRRDPREAERLLGALVENLLASRPAGLPVAAGMGFLGPPAPQRSGRMMAALVQPPLATRPRGTGHRQGGPPPRLEDILRPRLH